MKKLIAMFLGLALTAGAGTAFADKVVICHKGKNTIEVDAESLADHLAHGDNVDACPAPGA